MYKQVKPSSDMLQNKAKFHCLDYELIHAHMHVVCARVRFPALLASSQSRRAGHRVIIVGKTSTLSYTAVCHRAAHV